MYKTRSRFSVKDYAKSAEHHGGQVCKYLIRNYFYLVIYLTKLPDSANRISFLFFLVSILLTRKKKTESNLSKTELTQSEFILNSLRWLIFIIP